MHRVGRIPGAINVLNALGFREDEGGALMMPLDVNLLELEARRVEIEVGLSNNKSRFQSSSKVQGSGDSHKEPKASGSTVATEVKEGKDTAPSKAPISSQQRFIDNFAIRFQILIVFL